MHIAALPPHLGMQAPSAHIPRPRPVTLRCAESGMEGLGGAQRQCAARQILAAVGLRTGAPAGRRCFGDTATMQLQHGAPPVHARRRPHTGSARRHQGGGVLQRPLCGHRGCGHGIHREVAAGLRGGPRRRRQRRPARQPKDVGIADGGSRAGAARTLRRGPPRRSPALRHCAPVCTSFDAGGESSPEAEQALRRCFVAIGGAQKRSCAWGCNIGTHAQMHEDAQAHAFSSAALEQPSSMGLVRWASAGMLHGAASHVELHQSSCASDGTGLGGGWASSVSPASRGAVVRLISCGAGCGRATASGTDRLGETPGDEAGNIPALISNRSRAHFLARRGRRAEAYGSHLRSDRALVHFGSEVPPGALVGTAPL